MRDERRSSCLLLQSNELIKTTPRNTIATEVIKSERKLWRMHIATSEKGVSF
jgi:hypothetical protein